MADDTVLRFDEVSFSFGHNYPILDEAFFTVRRGSKITLMGQNGAGKSTIFKLVAREHRPESGKVITGHGLSIALSRQVIPRPEGELSVRDFFQKCFKEKVYDIDPRMDAVLEAVDFPGRAALIGDRIVKSFSGGQQARLLAL